MSDINFMVKVEALPGTTKGNPEYKATIETASINGAAATDLKQAYDAVSNMDAKKAGGSSSLSPRGGRSRKGKKSKGGKSRKARKSLRRK